jgi:hypothetical protein
VSTTGFSVDAGTGFINIETNGGAIAITDNSAIGSITIDASTGTGTVDIFASTLNFAANNFELNGSLPASPSTEFFRGDGTWAVPGGSSVTANNAITLTGSNLQWGGPLTQNTFIPSPTTPRQVWFGRTSGFAEQPLELVDILTNNGVTLGANATGSGGGANTPIMGINPFGVVFAQQHVSDTNTTINSMFEQQMNTTGVVAAGFGGRTNYGIEITAGLGAAITNEYLTTDVTGTGAFQWNICIGNAALTIDDTLVMQSFNVPDRNIGFFTKDDGFGGGTEIIKILNSTTPATALEANAIMLWAEDTSDATSSLAMFTEQAVEAIGGSVADNKLKVQINGVEYWILLTAV